MIVNSLRPYRWTFVLGVAFLGGFLWDATFSDGYGLLFVFFSLACFVVGSVIGLLSAKPPRLRDVLYPVAIFLFSCLLFFPTIELGGYFRNRIFLTHLSKFKEVTDFLVRDEREKRNSDVFITVVALPSGYSNLHVSDYVRIDSTKENISVRYTTRDSNALSHRGFMYRSDDSPAALRKEYPHTGYSHLAPHWFYFSE